MPQAKDDRRIVTPDAFAVAPELLGRPLAAPWRRGMAILADLVLVYLFTQLGLVSVALGASVIFFFLLTRQRIDRRWLWWTRGVATVLGSLVLFLGVLVWLEWSRPNPYTGMSPEMWVEFGKAAGSEDPEVRAQAAEKLVETLQASGVGQAQIEPALEALELPPDLMGPVQELILFGMDGGAPETAIVRLLERDTTALPYLAAALRRHLEQFPSLENGLGRTERQALAAVAAGRLRFAEIFKADQEREERPFMGDTTFRRYLERLASGDRPLLRFAADTAGLTEDGRRVLAGDGDQVRLNGIERWLGGVQLSGRTAWRWDCQAGLVRP